MKKTKRSLNDLNFKRMFSVNLHKDLKFKLGEMSFYKDWITTGRGDPYPVLQKSGILCETIAGGTYKADNFSGASQKQTRLLGQFFPYATYRIKLDTLSGAAGFSFTSKTGYKFSADFFISSLNGKISAGYKFSDGSGKENSDCREIGTAEKGPLVFVVTARVKWFDLYILKGQKHCHIASFEIAELLNIASFDLFSNTTASLFCDLPPAGFFSVSEVSWYLDSGISQADMRPIKFEDGTPYISEGKIFMSMTSRYEAGHYQAVISFNHSSCDFKLEGAVFYDTGDGKWSDDIASSIVFNRITGEWLVWMCSFSHGHMLGYGISKTDLRYGINIVDVTLMTPPPTETVNDETGFFARQGDEDPDFIYDNKRKKWLMAICRLCVENGKKEYKYFIFESSDPFKGYNFKHKIPCKFATGGSFVFFEGSLYFACGSSFEERAKYEIYNLEDFSGPERILCDYDDGGFRGWGTIMPVPCGSRTKYLWMTFDRHCGSDFNWSYGNIYVYSCYNDDW